MSAYRILILARRVIQQLLADPRTIALIIFVPLIVITVAGILLRADSSGLNVAIVMQDEGATVPLRGSVNLGQTLTDSLSNLTDRLHVSVLDAETARKMLEKGDLDAIITLPADFSSKAVELHQITLPVEFEGSNPMAAQGLQAAFSGAMIQSLASLSVISASLPTLELDATYHYGGADFDSLDYIAPVFIGLFVFLFVFILTSVAFLRERAAGTLERLQATSITSLEIMLGYMLGFSVFALIQAVIILSYTVIGLGIHYAGSLAVVFVVEILLALMAVNLGIFFSTFARNEFQVVQFIPLVIVTQILLSGAFWQIKAMPTWLQPFAWAMPLTYANQALRDVMIKGFGLGQILPYLAALLAFAVGLVVLAAQTVRRQG
ncbi:MAG TPA: ABC transporter permease [Phototrophicaceae bacterium]|jgi:ABC-2 type transport system permease protein|nr:ABC transporter permease [Phototrophicaceae bacterium]